MRNLSSGVWGGLVGPLGRAASIGVLMAAASSAATVAASTSRRAGTGRGVALGAVAFDLVGGLIAFQLHGTRRRYAGSPLRSRLVFALVHVQPFVLPALGEGSWRRAAARYTAAVASTAVLERLAPCSASRRALANWLAANRQRRRPGVGHVAAMLVRTGLSDEGGRRPRRHPTGSEQGKSQRHPVGEPMEGRPHTNVRPSSAAITPNLAMCMQFRRLTENHRSRDVAPHRSPGR